MMVVSVAPGGLLFIYIVAHHITSYHIVVLTNITKWNRNQKFK